MLVVRPATLEDLPGIEECARLAGIGLVNLPKRRDSLEKHIKNSISAFSKPSSEPVGDYFFVLADSATGSIEGTCAIYAGLERHPIFVFQIQEIAQPPHLPKLKESRLLFPKRYTEGFSEVCALYLKRHLRKEGFGRLLSISRFLFMAGFPHLFSKKVIASMRGVTIDDKSQFWEGLGQRFYDMSFHEIMSLRSENEQIISEILPNYPIYVALLNAEVQKLIGEIHPHTVPARKMLEQEGFSFNGEIDPIDGGPFLTAELPTLRTLRESRVAVVQEIHDEISSGENYLVSNNRLGGFRSCRTSMTLWDQERIVLPETAAEALQVGLGDFVRYISY